MSDIAAIGFNHVLPEHKLAQIVRDGENAAAETARTDGKGDRRCSVAWLTDWISPLWEVLSAINDAHFHYDLSGIETPQYTVYRDGNRYSWHMDQGGSDRHRKLSLTLQLSNSHEYDGGDLELFTGEGILTAKRDRASVMAFPAYILHQVTPVSRGTRRSLVVWGYGSEPFR